MNPKKVQQAANPLPFLFKEEAHRDSQATEAILLTFNTDPGFFEARILGVCQSAGARVCLVADGSVWDPDPYAIKHAGRLYHIGLVTRPGAFHPKLVLLVGPKRALAAVGSGNVTMGGWQHNAEIWTILHGDQEETPAAMGQVADIIDDVVREGIDLVATRSLTRASQELRTLLANCANVIDTGHQILSSTRGPIIEQLPTNNADRLRLYAPFHDDASRGIEQVIKRLQPNHVTVMVQPGSTVINPTALEGVLRASETEWEIVKDAEESGSGQRYRHGKLIEWTTPGGQILALTGSPNLSWAALCESSRRGNTEIAVLSPVQESLFPAQTPLDISEVPHVSISSPGEQTALTSESHPVLLSAVLDGLELTLTLNRPLTSPGTLELSLRGESPDTWSELAQVPADALTPSLKLDYALLANSRLRLLTSDSEGVQQVGKLVFVTDKSAVTQRHALAIKSRTATITPNDLLDGDMEVIAVLARDLERLARDISASRPPRATTGLSTPGQSEPARDTDTSDWLWVVDQATKHHGPHLAAFGLGLPAPPRLPGDERLDWEDVLVEDAETGLAEDTAEDTETDPEIEEVTTPDQVEKPDVSEAVREERRRRIKRWTSLINSVPLTSSLIVLRLSLVWWSAGDWKAGDPEPHRVISKMLEDIWKRDSKDGPGHEVSVASLGVVAMTHMRDRLDKMGSKAEMLTFLQLRSDLSHLGLLAQQELVEEYCQLLIRPSGFPLDPKQVMKNADEWSRKDPLSHVVEGRKELGYTVTRPGDNLLCFSGDFRNSERQAREAADLALENDLPIGVWAVSTTKDEWALVLWDRPNLVTAVKNGKRPIRWRHQRLAPPLGILSSVDGDGYFGVVKHGRRIDVPPIAHEMMEQLGISSPNPPEGWF